MMKDRLLLLDAIHLALNHPEYQPHDNMTYCNMYVDEVCSAMGYKNFNGLMANDMISLIEHDPQWSKIDMIKCQELANEGTLVLAGFKENPHGHINVICPGKEKTSGRWGQVPSCSNVGKEIFIGKGVNWAFSSMPTFWVWRPSL